ncbi:type II secretion system minor pseudopilin GspH [Simiduia agarivorans]|uniref:Type II secretion system protein H n=1 Tax=Simiduia agarivorans (strain DSM 21679 / JCM 13881 / BCRC 17597 / SA1) TaxID=1117647 RepID=K4KKP1_SIMAS|nr:type II secretion system minor pseudopilin GspH [Simiduia agarivorans]AFU99591.1 protein XcpU [Simiduia agarivorans SA1 = DSM 21679]
MRARGFTLIELMVVLLLVGLAIGMVNFNVGGNEERRARNDLDQLFQMLRYADENAALQGDLVGLQLSQTLQGTTRLEWKRFRGGNWLDAEAPFAASEIPEFVQLELRLDEQPVDLNKESQSPQVVFSGSGEISNFELRFSLADKPIRLMTVDFTGDLVQADEWEP